MRTLLITILTLSFFTSYTQIGKQNIFQKTDYLSGNFYRQTNDTIPVSSKRIDIFLFKKHFYIPYYLPQEFVNIKYRNQTISTWRDSNAKKDFQQNWENTYTYDSLGRVINYTYSSCLICSSTPYNYSVIYNIKGQIEQISNTVNEKRRFKFYYNDENDIVKLEVFLFDKLETVIELVH